MDTERLKREAPRDKHALRELAHLARRWSADERRALARDLIAKGAPLRMRSPKGHERLGFEGIPLNEFRGVALIEPLEVDLFWDWPEAISVACDAAERATAWLEKRLSIPLRRLRRSIELRRINLSGFSLAHSQLSVIRPAVHIQRYNTIATALQCDPFSAARRATLVEGVYDLGRRVEFALEMERYLFEGAPKREALINRYR